MNHFGFWKLAQEDPSHVAQIEPDGREITAGALLARANQAVHGLRALGLRRGDCIATVLPNEAATVELCLAALQGGLYITPINHHLTAPEIAYIVGDCDARAVFCSPRYGEACAAALESVAFPPGARFATGGLAGFRPYDELLGGQPDTLPAGRSVGATMTYTSGTTGRPRGVRRPLGDGDPDAASARFTRFMELFGITPRDGVHLVVSPLYHTAVLSFCLSSLHLGHTVVLMDRWDPEGTLQRIERYRVTTSHMVPTQFKRLLDAPDEVRGGHDLSSLRQVIHSAAPCPVDIKRRMLSWWGPVIYEYYSASEGGGTLATPAQWLAHPGTVGLPWPFSEIRVLDDEGRLCPPGQAGTIYIRMEGSTFEYHKDRDKTSATFCGDFFTVGDAGYLDREGYLFLCDRKADMIISGGVNIYPAEIESVLTAHPKIADVAVFGIPDDDWGEQVKAVVEPAAGVEGGPTLEAEIRSYCRERLAGYKCPRSFDFTDALPRDPNGKLYKRKLRDPYWQGRDRAI